MTCWRDGKNGSKKRRNLRFRKQILANLHKTKVKRQIIRIGKIEFLPSV